VQIARFVSFGSCSFLPSPDGLMKRWLTLTATLISLALVGCIDSSPDPETDAGEDDGGGANAMDPDAGTPDAGPQCPGCAAVGSKCNNRTECCSGVCKAARCEAISSCLVDGQVCTSGGECCTQFCRISPGCTTGTCSFPMCIPQGQICQFSDQCCDAPCIPDESGILRCTWY
jgi:hypothetical protein